MLPIHFFDKSEHYVLMRGGASVGMDRVERVTARTLLDAALRRDPGMVRELAGLLRLHGHDREHVITRAMASFGGISSELILVRARRHEVTGRRTVELPSEEYAPIENEIETHWIEVQLMSDDDPPEPVPGARYVIELPNGQIVTGVLDDSGMVRLDGIPPGQCKVSFPDHAEPDPAGEAEEEDEPPPPPDNTCEIGQFELACSHAGKRGAKIQLPARKQDGEELHVLEVIGAGKGQGDKINVAATMMGARCPEHAASAIEVKRPRPDEALLFAEDNAQFEAYYGAISLGDRLWPWDLKPTEYQIRPLTCDATARHLAIVRVFPSYEVSLKVSIALDAAERSAAGLAKARETGKVERRGRPAHTKWEFGIEGAIKYGTDSTTLGITLESKLKNLDTVNRWVKSAIHNFCSIFKEFFGLELELQLPNLSLEYSGKFVEIEKARTVGHEWSLTFTADPVFGVTLKVDVLDLTIRALRNIPALSVVATFLLKARDMAKKSGNTLEFKASLTGRVGFEAKGSKNPGNRIAQTSAKGVGQIIVGFEATAEASVGVLWFVSFEAGASIKGATGVKIEPGLLSEDKGLAVTAELTLLALKFEYGAYASGKFSWQNKPAAKAGAGGSHTFWEDKPLMEGKKYIVKYDGAAGAGQ